MCTLIHMKLQMMFSTKGELETNLFDKLRF